MTAGRTSARGVGADHRGRPCCGFSALPGGLLSAAVLSAAVFAAVDSNSLDPLASNRYDATAIEDEQRDRGEHEGRHVAVVAELLDGGQLRGDNADHDRGDERDH